MIVVKVELHSAITHKVVEIARMVIANNGTSDDPKRGDYTCYTLRGRNTASLEKKMWETLKFPSTAVRTGTVLNYPRLAVHVWNLVAAALSNMNYGVGTTAKRGRG